MFFTIIAVLLALGTVMWMWGAYLDKHEHDPGRVRAMMFIVLMMVSLTEIGLMSQGYVESWVLSLSLLANIWGGLDAVLRYPAAHDFESFFTWKQILLVATKTVAYSFGMVSFKQDLCIFLLVLFLNIWGLPVCYLMALPMDPREQVIAPGAYDADLLLRIWQLASCSIERRRCMLTCRGWMYRKLNTASERSPLARMVICVASSEHRRVLRKVGRSV